MTRVLMIALAGGIGAALRYGVVVGMHRFWGGVFPLGTMTVNIIGCLLIGFLVTMFAGSWQLDTNLELAIIVGLLGGFTTFSSYGLDMLKMVDSNRFFIAGSYFVLSNALGFFAAWGGSRLATILAK